MRRQSHTAERLARKERFQPHDRHTHDRAVHTDARRCLGRSVPGARYAWGKGSTGRKTTFDTATSPVRFVRQRKRLKQPGRRKSSSLAVMWGVRSPHRAQCLRPITSILLHFVSKHRRPVIREGVLLSCVADNSHQAASFGLRG